MAGGFPLGLEVCNGQSIGAVTGSSLGTTVTGGSTVSTLGAWTQIVASTTYDIAWLEVYITFKNPTNNAEVIGVNIGIGASGSEHTIISNLVMGGGADVSEAYYAFPCAIPAGTRIAAQAQSVFNGSVATYISLTGFDGAIPQIEGAAGVDNFGQATAPFPLGVPPGATADTKGSFVQLTASTAHDYIGLMGYLLTYAGLDNTSGLVDIAIGASGSEQVIWPNIPLTPNNASAFYPGIVVPFTPIPIPAGSRISARFQSTSTSDEVGVTLYGVYQ